MLNKKFLHDGSLLLDPSNLDDEIVKVKSWEGNDIYTDKGIIDIRKLEGLPINDYRNVLIDMGFSSKDGIVYSHKFSNIVLKDNEYNFHVEPFNIYITFIHELQVFNDFLNDYYGL